MTTTNWPKNAQALLEARYQAFVDGNIDFIFETIHPKTREQHNRDTIESWAKNSEWLGLDIQEVDEDEENSTINFSVTYRQDGQKIRHQETAEFRKLDGRWYYFDSTYPKGQTVRRDQPKVGRNDPCPCGSGKKYKKCCGNQ